ncbi:hypothetical protein H4R33_005710 [Dimargaris cristalligena]|uniref:Centromere protein H C-terminal domain-containing protein n=1 Tax=Dimargaris cristalligena TaxID=215637 RepID=A0A4P9ZQZ6_9FUNG|nr:hypothetical protein H4R33_005710 [Dimargaris cristalligena]RKP35755.1 hypothetical protein BJ085DRAFT_35416 [Dimargaris cristalligena]|eukprot:RKP35755.1 hypothetical protein BJ085DRAFT_35416 [Dimargaris cristalligena]
MTTTFQELQVLSTHLLKTVLRARVGIQPLQPAHFYQPLTHSEYSHFLNQQDQRASLGQQEERALAAELQNSSATSAAAMRQASLAEDGLLNTIDDLKAELLQEAAHNGVRLAILSNLALVDQVQKSNAKSAKDTSYVDIKLQETLHQRDKLSRELAVAMQDLAAVNDERQAIQQSLIAQHSKNRELMAKVQSIKGSSRSSATPSRTTASELRKLDSEHSKLTSQLEVIRNVLQGLILESGLDWAEDKTLQDIIMMLGEFD